MKKLFLVSFILFTTISINAQDTKNASTTGGTNVSIEGNIGTGTKEGQKLTYGGGLQIDFPVATGLKLLARAAYQNYNFKVSYMGSTIKSDAGFVPLTTGVKVPLGSKLFGQAELGYALATGHGGGGHFTYAPSLGIAFSIINLLMSYWSIGDLNAVALRAQVPLGKK